MSVQRNTGYRANHAVQNALRWSRAQSAQKLYPKGVTELSMRVITTSRRTGGYESNHHVRSSSSCRRWHRKILLDGVPALLDLPQLPALCVLYEPGQQAMVRGAVKRVSSWDKVDEGG